MIINGYFSLQKRKLFKSKHVKSGLNNYLLKFFFFFHIIKNQKHLYIFKKMVFEKSPMQLLLMCLRKRRIPKFNISYSDNRKTKE